MGRRPVWPELREGGVGRREAGPARALVSPGAEWAEDRVGRESGTPETHPFPRLGQGRVVTPHSHGRSCEGSDRV